MRNVWWLFVFLLKKLIKKPTRVGCLFLTGGSSGNRTSDTRIFSPLLYRLSYEAKKIMAVPTGFEPAIFCVTGRRDRPLHHGTMVAGAGSEPTTSGLWAQRATGLLHPAIKYYRWRRKRDSNPCAARTTSRFSRPVPSTRLGYSSKKMVPKVGLEPTRGLNLAGF